MTTKTENAAETKGFSTLGNALESAAEKFEEGSAVARQSAAQAAKVTRNFFADGVYKSAYRLISLTPPEALDAQFPVKSDE